LNDYVVIPILREGEGTSDPQKLPEIIEELRSEMLIAAESLDFETAARVRDRIAELEARLDKAPTRRRPKPEKRPRKRH
jgi:excinuclease UvrABC helicase subunit UvrB